MLNILAGPISISTEDLFSSPGGLILLLGIIGYIGFWIALIFVGYKVLRKFLKGDKRTKKQILLVLFILIFWFALLPATSWLIDKVNRDKYSREYEVCIEQYPRPRTPRGRLTEDEQKEYQNSDYYKNCIPIESKLNQY